jgi:hypothetical protein
MCTFSFNILVQEYNVMPFTVVPNDGVVPNPQAPAHLSLVSLRNYFGPVACNDVVNLTEFRPAFIGNLGQSNDPMHMNSLRNKRLPDITPNEVQFTVVGSNNVQATNVTAMNVGTFSKITNGGNAAYTATFCNNIMFHTMRYSVGSNAPDVRPDYLKLVFSSGSCNVRHYPFTSTGRMNSNISVNSNDCRGFSNVTITPYIVNTKRNGVQVGYVPSRTITPSNQTNTYTLKVTATAQATPGTATHRHSYSAVLHQYNYRKYQYQSQNNHHHSVNPQGRSDSMNFYHYTGYPDGTSYHNTGTISTHIAQNQPTTHSQSWTEYHQRWNYVTHENLSASGANDTTNTYIQQHYTDYQVHSQSDVTPYQIGAGTVQKLNHDPYVHATMAPTATTANNGETIYYHLDLTTVLGQKTQVTNYTNTGVLPGTPAPAPPKQDPLPKTDPRY